jgi:hypothetical protein
MQHILYAQQLLCTFQQRLDIYLVLVLAVAIVFPIPQARPCPASTTSAYSLYQVIS